MKIDRTVALKDLDFLNKKEIFKVGLSKSLIVALSQRRGVDQVSVREAFSVIPLTPCRRASSSNTSASATSFAASMTSR